MNRWVKCLFGLMAGTIGWAPLGAFPAESSSAPKAQKGWESLFNGKDLTGWTYKPDSWRVDDGVLTCGETAGDIWTEEQFGNFAIDLEFKVPQKGNSGVFVRTADPKSPVQTGIEIQVFDSYGKPEADKHDCGAVYDCVAPTKNMAKQAGEWNRMVVTCKDNTIQVELNGEPIIDMDVDKWTEPHMNPDGTKNKYNAAVKDFARKGYVGLQYHGKPVWYRNIKIKRMD